MDGITAIAVILIGSFAIDRITTGTMFLLALIKPWDRRFPDPAIVTEPTERLHAERKQKLVYFGIAGLLGIVVLAWLGNVRIFAALNFTVHWIMDTVVTGLVLVGGADRVAVALKSIGAPVPEKAPSSPIEVTGRLVLDQPTGATAGARPVSDAAQIDGEADPDH